MMQSALQNNYVTAKQQLTRIKTAKTENEITRILHDAREAME